MGDEREGERERGKEGARDRRRWVDGRFLHILPRPVTVCLFPLRLCLFAITNFSIIYKRCGSVKNGYS